MQKEIILSGAINEEFKKSYFEQKENLNIQKGDILNIFFDSNGGNIKDAYDIATDIKKINEDGVVTNGIANGNVWSSTNLPFLACTKRYANKDAEPSILVHNVKTAIQTDENGEALLSNEEMKQEIAENEMMARIMEHFYRNHGVSEDIIQYLHSNNKDRILETPEEMIENGFLNNGFSSVLSMPSKAIKKENFLEKCKNYFPAIYPKKPIFTSVNYQNLKEIEESIIKETEERTNNLNKKKQSKMELEELKSFLKEEMARVHEPILREIEEIKATQKNFTDGGEKFNKKGKKNKVEVEVEPANDGEVIEEMVVEKPSEMKEFVEVLKSCMNDIVNVMKQNVSPAPVIPPVSQATHNEEEVIVKENYDPYQNMGMNMEEGVMNKVNSKAANFVPTGKPHVSQNPKNEEAENALKYMRRATALYKQKIK
jgi:ATP-dependent protease ClpP protease subunit